MNPTTLHALLHSLFVAGTAMVLACGAARVAFTRLG